MTDSYLAIVSSRGLERLVIETRHAAVFLFRQAARQPLSDAVVCWAVLDDRTARNIGRQVQARRYEEALRQLNARAYHLGTLLPSMSEDEVLRAS